MAEDMRTVRSTDGIAEFDRGYEVPDCIVLDSAYCSMGRMVAVRACEAAGWTYHDSVTLLDLVPECGVSTADVDAFDRQLADGDCDVEAMRASGEYRRIASAFRLAVERALAQGPCLIHDRASRELVEGLGYRAVTAMTVAHDAAAMRVRARISPLYEHLTTNEELDAAIAREDNVRRVWHALASDATRRGDPATYDLMLSTDRLGRDFSAQLLSRLMLGQR